MVIDFGYNFFKTLLQKLCICDIVMPEPEKDLYIADGNNSRSYANDFNIGRDFED